MTNGMSMDTKKLVMTRLEEMGAIEYTREVLNQIYISLIQELTVLEEAAGVNNWILRYLFHRLKL